MYINLSLLRNAGHFFLQLIHELIRELEEKKKKINQLKKRTPSYLIFFTPGSPKFCIDFFFLDLMLNIGSQKIENVSS